MPYDANAVVKALREAQTLAMAHRSTAAVVASGSKLKAVLRPSERDVVVISNVNPPMMNADIERAAAQALHEFEDARPALDRVIDILDKDGRGKPRNSVFVAEVFAALVGQFLTKHSAERKGLAQPEKPTLWTMLFGR